MRAWGHPPRKNVTKRGAAPPPPAGPSPEQMEIRRLTQDNARLSAAAAEATEDLEAAKEEAAEVGKREAALADLLAAAGYDTLSLNTLEWSAPAAQELLRQEAEQLVQLQVSVVLASSNSRPPHCA